MPVTTTKAPEKNVFDFDDDDEEGWQDMPVVHEDTIRGGLDEEDQKKYHYVSPSNNNAKTAANATGNLIDFDDHGNEWRSKGGDSAIENEYTRLRGVEEDESDEVHMRTKYLFDEDKAMTPLSQMQATKNLLTEGQRIAYVGLCALTSREMAKKLKDANRKELKQAASNMELWLMKIMGRLYYHMELELQGKFFLYFVFKTAEISIEQKMIESLGEHGVEAMDLVPSLMTTHTITNPEYDPAEARRKRQEDEIKAAEAEAAAAEEADDITDSESISGQTIVVEPSSSDTKSPSIPPPTPGKVFQTTTRVLEDTSTSLIPGVSTSLSAADEKVTLDIRWTVLCDLFLILIADSVYDARSRVLLESVALKLGLGWLDVVRFESRVTEALEIQEGVEKMENQDIIDGRMKAARRKRYMMMGLATLGGGLVIGLSAGLLAPVIGLGLGTAFGTIGVSGASAFLTGAGGAAVITTGGVLTGSGIAAKGMARRTQQVRTFDVLPLHNNKRVSCILTVPGFLNGNLDDPRLPFSVLDPIVGDVYSVLWEPEMIRETGGALKILTGEVLTQIGQTVLQATVMATLMTALQWPIILTKLGYLIDNPWNNALDRAKAAGSVLADVLLHRNLGVRPVTLIGFSLGARVIFYALIELAKHKAYGIVQDVFLMGATISVSQKMWNETRSVVSGRYVNAYARNDWVLNYLFRATSGGVGTVAGLRPIEGVAGLENVDVTDKIAGHMSYRTFMPLILDQLGFPVFADYFDEPEDPDFEGDRVVVQEEEEKTKKGWFSRKNKKTSPPRHVSRPPSASSFSFTKKQSTDGRTSLDTVDDEDLPPRVENPNSPTPSDGTQTPTETGPAAHIPKHAGFDFAAIKDIIGQAEQHPEELKMPTPIPASGSPQPPYLPTIHLPPPTNRTESAPIPGPPTPPSPRARSVSGQHPPIAEPSTSALTSSMRSMSFTNGYGRRHEEEEEEEEDLASQPPPPPEKNANPYTRSPAVSPQVGYRSSPALSFGSSDGSLWSSDPSPSYSQSPFGAGLGSNSSFSSPRIPNPMDNGLSFGGADGAITSPANDFYTPARTNTGLSFGGAGGSITNPFSSTTSIPTTSTLDAGLSFGGADGSITSSFGGGSSKTTNTWSIPSDLGAGKKKPPGNSGNDYSNPWS
ncbi:hypothetical protein V5O48_014689 [Marasmius crinis-equi]|uniref:DUF726-domain-containing protein n=1 Tax=Marasmius crinis-equi TaxID=585013 RepID=A0ABR3EWM8_9AGAR